MCIIEFLHPENHTLDTKNAKIWSLEAEKCEKHRNFDVSRVRAPARARTDFYETMFFMCGKVLVTIYKKIHVDISIRAGLAHCANFVPLTWKSANPNKSKNADFLSLLQTLECNI